MTTISIEGRRVKVSDDFRTLPREEQERIVAEIAQQIGVSAGDRQSGPMRALGLVNTGIAGFGDSLAGPLNVGVNRAIEALGGDYRLSEQPFAETFDRAGIRRAEPESLGERALVGAGEAALAMVPATAALRGLSGASGLTGQVARSANTAYVAAPASAISAELAAGAAAPVAGELASRAAGGSEAARGLGAVAGGMAAGLGVANVPNALRAAGRGVMATPIAGGIIRGATTAVAPFTRTGARMIAEDAVRRVTPDRFQAANNLADENIGNLTPAQRTGDEGIMGIERAVASQDPRTAAALRGSTEASARTLRGEIQAPAQGREVRDLKTFFQDRMEHHRSALDRYVRHADRQVELALRNVRPGSSREDASAQVVRVLDDAFERAAQREAELWARVPRDTRIGTAQARQALSDARTETTRISEDAIPAKARTFLGQGEQSLGDDASMAELHRLYSEMRRAGREAMAKPVPDEFTARQSNRIAEAILADIEAAEATSGAARIFADARAYSREMNEAFGQGAVARALARTRAGDERMAPETVLRRTVGEGREAGGVAVDDIRRAVGNEADPRMQDFLRDEFLTSATGPDGQPALRQIDTFANRNREALARFPEGAGAEVAAVRRAAAEAARRADRRSDIVAALNETQRGTVAGLANARKGREIAAGIFEADNPAAAARAIARAAQRDGTGDAYLGLKAALADEVISRSSAGGAISGRRMMEVLDDAEMRRVLAASLPPGEVSRLRTIAAQFRKLETSMTAQQVETENLPNTLLSTFVQIQAAKAGRAMGTGTIQVPGMVVSRARGLINRVATDHADAMIRAAMEDPRLLSDLLVGPSAGRARMLEAETRVANWAIGVLAAYGEE